MYLLEAAPALLLAPLVVLRLRDRPEEAHWLTTKERRWLADRLRSDRLRVETPGRLSFVDALRDARLLLLAAAYFTHVCLLNSITFFLPHVVKGFGMTDVQTGFIVAAPSLLGLVALIAWGRHSDRRQERYAHAALANVCGGAALLSSVLLHDPGLRIAVIAVAFACTLAFTAPFWSIPGTFLTGSAAAWARSRCSRSWAPSRCISPTSQAEDVTPN